jgi:hypothetical protein
MSFLIKEDRLNHISVSSQLGHHLTQMTVSEGLPAGNLHLLEPSLQRNFHLLPLALLLLVIACSLPNFVTFRVQLILGYLGIKVKPCGGRPPVDLSEADLVRSSSFLNVIVFWPAECC